MRQPIWFEVFINNVRSNRSVVVNRIQSIYVKSEAFNSKLEVEINHFLHQAPLLPSRFEL